MRRCRSALAMTTAIALAAGPTASYVSAATYVGTVSGSDAFIAISKDARKIGGYLCDEGKVSRWLEDKVLHNGRAPLVGGTTGKRLGSVKVAGRVATGRIAVSGSTMHTFRAVRVEGRKAGLFFGVGKQKDRILVAGWILRPNGTQRGAVSSVNTRTLNSLPAGPAPRLKPGAERVQLTGDPQQPPVVTEPEHLVVINIIAILIALLVPAVQA